jgi:hypothetical protein
MISFFPPVSSIQKLQIERYDVSKQTLSAIIFLTWSRFVVEEELPG